jgi:hypothetical protein
VLPVARSKPTSAGSKRTRVGSTLKLTDSTSREQKAQLLARSNPFGGKPPVDLLDISAGWDSIAKFDIVIQRLKNVSLYSEDLVFCPADWGRIENLGLEKQHNEDDDPCIQGSDEAGIRDKHAERNMAAEMCGFGVPALIVYKKSMLEEFDEYRYLPPPDVPLREAVVIIFLLTADHF